MKKYLSLFVAFVFMFSFSFAKAEETTQPVLPAVKAGLRAEYQVKIDAQKEAYMKEMEAKRAVLKADIETKKAAIKGEIEAKKAEFAAMTPAQKQELLAKIKTDRDAFRMKIDADRDAFKKEVAAKKEEFKKAKAEVKAKFRADVQVMIGNRFTAAVLNITNVQVRIGAVIAKLNANGADTTQASAYLEISKQKLADAKVKIAEVKALIPSADAQVTADVYAQIKTGARDAKELLQESHHAASQAVEALKGLRMENKADVSVSGSVEANTSSEQ